MCASRSRLLVGTLVCRLPTQFVHPSSPLPVCWPTLKTNPSQSIGLLSALITSLEANPLPATLYRNSTYFRSLQCTAAHDPGLSDETRDLIDRARLNDGALRALQDVLTSADERRFRAVTGTTQAVDLVGGGVKVNALPESAWAVVDHRIADHRCGSHRLYSLRTWRQG